MNHTINEAAKILGYTPKYVRFLIRKKMLKSFLVPIFEGSAQKHHVISDEDIEEYKKVPNTRSRRSDSRYKFIFYATSEEYHEVVRAVESAGYVEVAKTMMPANTIKAIGFLYDPTENGSGRFVDIKHQDPSS